MKRRVKISKLYEFDGLNKVEVQRADIGSIVAISGISDIHIGDTICSPENPVAIPFQKISEPTIAMNFMVNDSPLAGQEGKFVTSRHLRERLFRELNTDVSLRVEETDNTVSYTHLDYSVMGLMWWRPKQCIQIMLIPIHFCQNSGEQLSVHQDSCRQD